MNDIGIGNLLNRVVCAARASMFDQGEFAQLTYSAFYQTTQNIQASQDEEFEIAFPVGVLPDHTTVPSTRTYKKDQLLGKYQYLALNRLSINGIFQLVTLVESLLSDVIRFVVFKYPHKLGAKRQIKVQQVLESRTIEEVHYRATEGLIHELSFKGPAEFAQEFESLTGVRLLECATFQSYIEVKATRDVYIHNRGIANELYVRKSGSHVRAQEGMQLHVDVQYFLESYECCLKVVDWLETELHDKWHSSEYETRNSTAQLPLQEQGASGPAQA